jgi:hypothetical protein
LENFDMPGEVACMTKGANEQVVVGLINGGIALIDTATL